MKTTIRTIVFGLVISAGLYALYVLHFKENQTATTFVPDVTNLVAYLETVNVTNSELVVDAVDSFYGQYESGVNKVFDINAYKNYATADKKIHFKDLTDLQKALFMSYIAEESQQNLFNIYSKMVMYAVEIGHKNGEHMPDIKANQVASKYFELSKKLAKMHLEFVAKIDGMQIGDNKITLNDNQKKQIEIYIDKLTKQYKHKGLL